MEDEKKSEEKSNFIKLSVKLILLWTIILGLSLSWNIFHQKNHTFEIARIHARDSFNRDILFRMWNAAHGGVYARVTKSSQPNQYLSFIPERDIKTPSGKLLTMINPAYMTRQLYELTKNMQNITGHITSLKPIRPGNEPDQWERKALQSFESGADEFSSVEAINGKKYMRLMRPLVTKKPCLKCHARHGYREGGIRGGISVAVPMSPIREIEQSNIFMISLVHLILWMTGTLGILLAVKRIDKSERKRKGAMTALQKSETNLRNRNETIEKDLNTARSIQRSLISSRIPVVSEVKINYKHLPLDAVGGDYFSFRPLREGGLGVFIGDVASHGVTAALFLSLIKATTDRIGRNHPHSPEKYLELLNTELIDNMPKSFLTAHYGYFFSNKNSSSRLEYTFSSGGHPDPIILRAKTREVESLFSKGTLIGIFKDLKFEVQTVSLEKGDRIFLYTDGIPETFNKEKVILGYDRIPEIIAGADQPLLGDMLDAIIEKVNKYRGDSPIDDDIVLIGIEVL